MLLPSKTSHLLLGEQERARQGISDRLIRFSVGIEEVDDLKDDINAALNIIAKAEVQHLN